MKVILNQDVPNLGELGDVRDVAAGYARNFLFPRNFAFNQKAIALFERRKTEIDDLRATKRSASASLKDRIEAEEIVVDVPAGQNGKLYGAVTGHSIADELAKKGIEIDRKRIEIPGRSIKSVGNYKILVRLYEKEEATLRLAVHGHEVKSEAKAEDEAPRPRRRRFEERQEGEAERPQLTPEEDRAAQAAAFEAAVNAPPRPQRKPRREDRDRF
jgi:large subunit ribosomal protein L9